MITPTKSYELSNMENIIKLLFKIYKKKIRLIKLHQMLVNLLFYTNVDTNVTGSES